jgi:acetyl esterase/lipase
VLFGESAGATIAALVALEPSAEVAGVIDWYGPSNLVSMAAGLSAEDAATTRETGWLGVSALDDPQRAKDASPVFQVHAGAPPFLIAHGLADRFVPSAQSEEMTAALEGAGILVDFTLVGGADHMWGGDGVDTGSLLEQALVFAARVTAIHHLTKEPA